MGFSRQEYWSGLPFFSPGDLPDPGIKPRSPALQADSLPSEPRGKTIPSVLSHTQQGWKLQNYISQDLRDVRVRINLGFADEMYSCDSQK